MRSLVLIAVVMASVAGSARAAEDGAEKKFQSFCSEWMQKLAVRERDNRAGIHWQVGPDGVAGEYVGYSQKHECQLIPAKGSNGVPIGKVVYRELRYRQTGASTSAAERSEPRALEATEVTEIFRYSRGRWVY